MIRIKSILALLLISNIIYTQPFSIGFGIGGANYSGDMTANLKAVIQQAKPSLGINIQYDFDPFLSLKLGFESLKATANDKLGIQEWQKQRDLNFKSSIYSIDLSANLNIKNLIAQQNTFFNFYLQGGYSFFHFNPVTNFQGKSVELRHLGTEGQGMLGYNKKYSSWAGAINFGLCLEYILDNFWSIESQLLLRKTNTDYIDDLSTQYVDYDLLAQQNGILTAQIGNKNKAPQGSQRGNPVGNDWYQSLVIGVKYRIYSKQHDISRKSRRTNVNCPKFKI